LIVTVKNDEGFVTAYLEFNIVDKFGRFDDDGDYCYVAEAWVHDSLKRTHVLWELVKKVCEHKNTQHCQWVYWVRERDPNDLKIYPVSKFKKEKLYGRQEFTTAGSSIT